MWGGMSKLFTVRPIAKSERWQFRYRECVPQNGLKAKLCLATVSFAGRLLVASALLAFFSIGVLSESFAQQPTLVALPSSEKTREPLSVLGDENARIESHASGQAGKAARQRTQTAARLSKNVRTPPLLKNFGNLPLSFEENQGQVDAQVKYLARGKGYTLFLTETEAVLSLRSVNREALGIKPEAEGEGSKTALQGGGPVNDLASLPSSASSSPSVVRGDPSEFLPFVRGDERGVESRDNRTATESVIRMTFAGANQTPKVSGDDQLPGIVNYFIGNDPEQWRTKIPTYKKVQYDNLYDGIDLVYYGNQGQLEYDLVVEPGADPSQIQLAFEGAEYLTVNEAGDLVLSLRSSDLSPLPSGERTKVRGNASDLVSEPTLRLLKPHVYQLIEGEKVEVAASYVVHAKSDEPQVADVIPAQAGIQASLRHFRAGGDPEESPTKIDSRLQHAGMAEGGAGMTDPSHVSLLPSSLPTVAIHLAAYDATKPLIIDPVLHWSTYLGTSGNDSGAGIAVDAAGAVYVSGATNATGFPGALGNPIQPGGFAGSGSFGDAFVVKLNPAGTGLVYATYLGTSGGDAGWGLAVDATGAAYVTGPTEAAGFPGAIGNPIQPGGHAGGTDAFVAKLNSAGTALTYATYLGTSGEDFGHHLEVDAAGAAYVTGQTGAAGFPGALGNPIQPGGHAGDQDAFVAKLNPAGAALAYATYLGTSGRDIGVEITVDVAGTAYVTGLTEASGFPGASGSVIQPDGFAGGVDDAFVAAIVPSGQVVTWGNNDSGALGDGLAGGSSMTDFFPATLAGSVQPLPDEFVQVAAGFETTLALKADGTVWAWGLGSRGQLGQNCVPGVDCNSSTVPLQVQDPTDPSGFLSNVVAIASGLAHNVALKSDGTVWAWGANNLGQVGDNCDTTSPGACVDQRLPSQVVGLPSLSNVIAISANSDGSHSIALLQNTGVFAWGNNNSGELGSGLVGGFSSSAEAVDNESGDGTLAGIVAVAAGANHNLALKSDGTMVAWGQNADGQLRIGSNSGPQPGPSSIDPSIFTDFVSIAAGARHSLALRNDGTVWAWGDGSDGQTGDGTFTDRNTPGQVLEAGGTNPILGNVSRIAAGATHSLAIKGDGTVRAWGSNGFGEIGIGAVTVAENLAQQVKGLSDVVHVAGGRDMSVALTPLPESDVTVTTTVSADPVAVNDPIVYTITVGNPGTDSAWISLRDFLPTGVNFVPFDGGNPPPASSSSECIALFGTSVVECGFRVVPGGGSTDYIIAVTAPGSPDLLTNVADARRSLVKDPVLASLARSE